MSWKLARDVRFRRVFDEAVVIRQDASEVLGLNLVAVRILELVRDGLSEAKVIEALSGEFEVETDVLRADVAAFFEELAESGLIERQEGG